MCNACGFLCCGYDGFSGCGCDHCPHPECWTDDIEDEDDFDYDADHADQQEGPRFVCVAITPKDSH